MSHLPEVPPSQKPALYRSPRGKMLAGVCAGLAEKTGINVWVFRVLFILGNFLPGPGLVVYILMALLVPMDRS